MLDTAREGCFLVGAIVCIKRKVFLCRHQYINTLYTCLFCSELQQSEPVGCWHSPKNDLRKHWMSERGQIHELQHRKNKTDLTFFYIFKALFLLSTTNVQNIEKSMWLHWRGACTGSTSLRFTLVWILVPEGTGANHAHAAWALRQRQRAAQGRSSVQLQRSVLSRDAVGPSHSWRSTNRAGYCTEDGDVDVLSVQTEAQKNNKKKKQQVCISTHPYMSWMCGEGRWVRIAGASLSRS